MMSLRQKLIAPSKNPQSNYIFSWTGVSECQRYQIIDKSEKSERDKSDISESDISGLS